MRLRREKGADAIVAGSGGAGLLAALRAAERGLDVTVLERADHLGGTTSASGGLIWAPGHHHGAGDARDALDYLRRLTGGLVADENLTAFVDTAPAMAEYLEAQTPLSLSPMPAFPDYRQDLPGASRGGRGLEALPYDAKRLGDWAPRVRMSPFYTALTLTELKRGSHDPSAIPWDRAADRIRAQQRTLGAALIGGLLEACLARGVQVQLGVRARELVVEDGRVTGLVATGPDGEPKTHTAARGVILASGGFDWNPRLTRALLGVPVMKTSAVPSNEGDGLTMALRAGAALTGVREAWWEPLGAVPGEEWSDGGELARPIVVERTLPGSIIVNRAGHRFVNEAMNYHDLGRRMLEFSGDSYGHPHAGAWTIMDAAFRRRYVVMSVPPGEPAPDWLPQGDTLAELARAVGINAGGLDATVRRFNAMAERGVDEDFHRGESLYDRYQADPRHEPNASLAPLTEPPFFALPTYPGMVGTKTGLDVGPRAEVLDAAGRAIGGLYACGNVAGTAVTGTAIPGPGGTLGPALTWGFLAGTAISAS